MSVGFVMLAHANLDRAGDVACHLARQGMPVFVHLDARTPAVEANPFLTRMDAEPAVYVVPRLNSDWGTFGLIDATLAGVRMALGARPELQHICLLSGSCVPLQSGAVFQTYLSEHPETDFIESVAIEDATWAVDGLEEERFTFTFPFSWKRQRRLFDAWVEIQRLFKRRRRPPEGLVPHMGSQWWCLTTKTLRAILDDPDLPQIARYFRKTWIPDESFFQTLARRHARNLVSESPTLARFGFRGCPHLFYDDHIELLVASGAFFARKIWPGADELYDYFLGPTEGRLESERRPRVAVELARSVDRRAEGRAGLVMPGRSPKPWAEVAPTAAPYAVLHGFDALYPDIQAWIARQTSDVVHGRLFAPDRVHFEHGGDDWRAGMSSSAALRDYDAKGFLRNLIWSARGEHQFFLTAAEDLESVSDVLAKDPHASVYMITGAWALGLDDADLDMRQKAAELQRAEIAGVDLLKERWSRARVRTWTLADALAAPDQPLRVVLDEHLGRAAPAVLDMPELRDLSGLGDRLTRLRNGGVPSHLAGDVATVLQRKLIASQTDRRHPS